MEGGGRCHGGDFRAGAGDGAGRGRDSLGQGNGGIRIDDVDPTMKVAISAYRLHQGSDYTPYEGMEVTGWPVTTIVRGTVIVDRGELRGAMGHGIHLTRGLPSAERHHG
jgi:hypothetical protein